MTAIKFLLPLSLFLIVGCGGQNVKIPNTLESVSLVNEAHSTTTTSPGTLQRKSNSAEADLIIVNGQSYKVSMYSSYAALEFIAARGLGTLTAVTFKGKLANNEVVLEELK